MNYNKKNIVFDTGPIINFAITGLLPKLTELKKHYKGDFIITSSVEKELIDRPLSSKKFRLEALQVLKEIQSGTFKVFNDKAVSTLTKEILDLANTCFKAKGNWIRIVSYAEISVLALAIHLNSEAVIIDERTTRLLVEDPYKIKTILQKKLHTNVFIDKNKIEMLKELLKNIKVLRSVDLAVVMFEKNIFDEYIISGRKLNNFGLYHHNFEHPKFLILESVLWALKLNGCSITNKEITEILNLEKKSYRKIQGFFSFISFYFF